MGFPVIVGVASILLALLTIVYKLGRLLSAIVKSLEIYEKNQVRQDAKIDLIERKLEKVVELIEMDKALARDIVELKVENGRIWSELDMKVDQEVCKVKHGA